MKRLLIAVLLSLLALPVLAQQKQRVVIQVSGLARSRLHSMCGMNGGTKTQSPSSMST